MNTRIFQNHFIRKELQLDPVWSFFTLNSEEKVKEYKMLVPSCWESHPELSSYKGKALYSKKVTFGGNVRLYLRELATLLMFI